MPDEHDSMPPWPRPLHDESSGHLAELMYVIVGPIAPEPLSLSRSRHHVSRIEPELVVSKHRRADDPAWFAGWFADPLAAGLDGQFLDPGMIKSSDELTVVRANFADPPSLDYLRNTLGVVSAVVETGALTVFDVHAVQWWRPGEWLEVFVDASRFEVRDHVAIISTDEPDGNGVWLHTRGMIKFARPDVQVRHVPANVLGGGVKVRHAGNILHAIAGHLADGAILSADRPLHLPGLGAVIGFVESADDRETAKHFNNAALELRDYDPDSRTVLDTAEKLLAATGPDE